MEKCFKSALFVILISLMSILAQAQNKRKILLELSGNPIITSFKKDNYAASYNLGFSHFVSEKFNIGLQFHNTYSFDKKAQVYDASSSLGISTAYNFFKGAENSFCKDVSFELCAALGGGVSNFNDDTTFLYGDLSLRVYVRNLVFLGIGYNHKRYDKKIDFDNSNSLYFSFGFRF